jgi:hypothetical protein
MMNEKPVNPYPYYVVIALVVVYGLWGLGRDLADNGYLQQEVAGWKERAESAERMLRLERQYYQTLEDIKRPLSSDVLKRWADERKEPNERKPNSPRP